ncbi:MAG: FecR domain-containing protein [bacterium]
MKKLGAAFIVVVFLLALSVTLNAASPIAKVTLIKGKVSAYTGSKSRVLSKGASLFSGDKVVTAADGKIEIRFSDSSIVRLASNSSIYVSKGSDPNGRGQIGTNLQKGKNWVNAAKPSDSWGGLKSKTPLAVASIKGTVYRQTVAADTTTKISVYKGEVEVLGKPAEEGKKPGGGEIKVEEGPWGAPGKKPGGGEVKVEEGPWGAPGKKPGSGEVKVEEGPWGEPHEVTEEEKHPIGEPGEVSMEQWLEIVRELQQITITPDGKHTTESIPADDAKDEWVVWNKELDSNELKKEP